MPLVTMHLNLIICTAGYAWGQDSMLRSLPKRWLVDTVLPYYKHTQSQFKFLTRVRNKYGQEVPWDTETLVKGEEKEGELEDRWTLKSNKVLVRPKGQRLFRSKLFIGGSSCSNEPLTTLKDVSGATWCWYHMSSTSNIAISFPYRELQLY